MTRPAYLLTPLLLLLTGLLAATAIAGPIHDAAKAGDLPKVTALLTADPALLNARGDKGYTPLLAAVDQRHMDVAALLIERGADVKMSGDGGITPLMAAAGQNALEITRTMLDKGASPKVADKDAWTALHYAAVMGQADTVRLLLARGADSGAKNSKGQTPYDLALIGKHPDVAALLTPPSPAGAPTSADHAGQIAAQTAAIEKEPNQAVLYLQRGRTHAQLTTIGILGVASHPEADAARADYDKAIALDPALAEAYAYRALLHDGIDLTRTGPGSEWALAIADADKSVMLAPHDAVIYVCRGILRQNAIERTATSHMFDRSFNKASTQDVSRLALADLDQAITLNPKVAGGHRERARIRGWLGADAALEQADLEQAVAEEPSDAETVVNLVNVASRRQDWPAARKAVDTLIALHPDMGDAYKTRSQIRSQQADMDGAFADADRAVALDTPQAGPPLAAALLVRGIVQLAQKKVALAEADERRATEIDPANASPWDRLGRLQGDAGRLDDAVATLRQGLTRIPQSVYLHLTLGLLLALKDDVDGTKAEYAAGLRGAAPPEAAAQAAVVQAFLKQKPESAGLKAALAVLQAAGTATK